MTQAFFPSIGTDNLVYQAHWREERSVLGRLRRDSADWVGMMSTPNESHQIYG